MPIKKENDKTYIEIGYIKKLHGIKGELELVIGDDELTDLIDKKGWVFLEINGELIPFQINNFYNKGLTSIILDLKDIYNLNQAKRLVKKSVLVEVSSEELEEYLPKDIYFEQFIGYTGQLLQNKQTFGTLEEITDSPINPLLVFKLNEKTVSIPIFSDFIKEIDTTNKIIYLDLPAGYLDVF